MRYAIVIEMFLLSFLLAVAVTVQGAQEQGGSSSPDRATFAARAREAVLEELRGKNLLSPEIEVEMVSGPVEFPGDHLQLHQPQAAGQARPDQPPTADLPEGLIRRFANFAIWRDG